MVCPKYWLRSQPNPKYSSTLYKETENQRKARKTCKHCEHLCGKLSNFTGQFIKTFNILLPNLWRWTMKVDLFFSLCQETWRPLHILAVKFPPSGEVSLLITLSYSYSSFLQYQHPLWWIPAVWSPRRLRNSLHCRLSGVGLSQVSAVSSSGKHSSDPLTNFSDMWRVSLVSLLPTTIHVKSFESPFSGLSAFPNK